MGKLHEVIAVEKATKSRAYSALTELDKAAQKADTFNGFAKSFAKLTEDGEDYPAESKKVTMKAADLLAQIGQLNTEYFDIEATKDRANQTASADVVVDGTVLISKAPVALLLFLEKQLTDVRTMVERIPVLDENKDWTFDPNSLLYRTEPARTHKTKKVPKVIVKYDATDKHPAQTEMTTEDIIVGHWSTTHLSGALPLPERLQYVNRLTKLLNAVKVARQQANDVEVKTEHIGASLFAYLFKQ